MSQRRQVFFENWQTQLEAAVADLRAHIRGTRDSPERDTLATELEQLEELVHQVRDRLPVERDDMKSHISWVTVRGEAEQFPEDLVQRLGEIFEIYRRFKARLEWCHD